MTCAEVGGFLSRGEAEVRKKAKQLKISYRQVRHYTHFIWRIGERRARGLAVGDGSELQRGTCSAAIGRHLPLRYNHPVCETVRITKPAVCHAERRIDVGNAVDAGVAGPVGDPECDRAAGIDARLSAPKLRRRSEALALRSGPPRNQYHVERTGTPLHCPLPQPRTAARAYRCMAGRAPAARAPQAARPPPRCRQVKGQIRVVACLTRGLPPSQSVRRAITLPPPGRPVPVLQARERLASA
jgi:hypothetical protein